MSYSFNVRASSKLEAGRRIAEELANVVQHQPVHAEEEAAVVTLAQELTDVLRPLEAGELIDVHVNGSVWAGEKGLNSVSAQVTAAVVAGTT